VSARLASLEPVRTGGISFGGSASEGSVAGFCPVTSDSGGYHLPSLANHQPRPPHESLTGVQAISGNVPPCQSRCMTALPTGIPRRRPTIAVGVRARVANGRLLDVVEKRHGCPYGDKGPQKQCEVSRRCDRCGKGGERNTPGWNRYSDRLSPLTERYVDFLTAGLVI
jgi:hypothetical protein